MKTLIPLLIFFFLALATSAQTTFPYRLTPLREAAIGAPALGLSAWGYTLNRRETPLTVDQIQHLNPPDLRWACDRRALAYWSPAAARRSDWLLYASLATPVAVALAGPKNHPNQSAAIAVMGFETLSLTYGITSLTKSFSQRNRPFVYHTEAPLSFKTDPDARHSFFSGHTSMSAASCFFTARVFSDLYPKSRWKPWVWGGAAILPAWTAYQRIRAGKHFPTDVVVGYAVGALVGILIPKFHQL